VLNLKSKRAALLFRKGKYEEALQIYRQLSRSIHDTAFLANIYLCEKKLHSVAPSIIAIKQIIQRGGQFTDQCDELHPLGLQTSSLNGKGQASLRAAIDGTKPLMFEHPVDGIGEIGLQVDIRTTPGGDDKNIAVLAVEFLDHSRNVLQVDHPSFGHSEKFSNYRYLQPGTNKITFTVPESCSTVTLEIRRWKSGAAVYMQLPLICHIKNDDVVQRLPKWQAPGFIVPTLRAESNAPLAISIMDEFSELTFGYDLQLLPVTPENWADILEKKQPDLLFVESAWKGNAGAWQYALTNPRNPKHQSLKRLISACKRRNIPSVFWNKEDPPNFNVFLESAKLFDFVFTTDSNCIESYKKACGHQNIYALPFAAQPKIHNPIGKSEKAGREVAFAGTWYAKKHQERCALAPLLFDPAVSKGLTIFNRMSDWTHDDSYDFPDMYRPHVKPKVSYREMLSVHKLFKVFLNINSVTDSPTMFSRRVFEVLASATPVISTASVGVQEMFGSIVPVIETKEHADQALDRLLSNDLYRKKTGHLGYRLVMRHHTVRERLRFSCNKIGIRYEIPGPPKVTWAVPTNRPDHLRFIKENFYRQKYTNIELIIALNSDEFNIQSVRSDFAGDDRVKIIQLPERCSLGEVLNATIDEMSGNYWMKIDDDNIYLENFTADMMLPFMYAECAIVGKGSYFAYLESSDETILRFPGQDNRFVSFCSGSALAVHKDVFIAHRFPDQSVGEDTVWMKSCLASGEQIYSPDIFNYSVVRRASKASHTWKADDNALRKGACLIGSGKCLAEISA